ncbi:M23 family metallopeptidase [Mesoterricola sediminis]|nr:M23 family metallopeptidase [Mesoterricola sediminis]
MSLAAALCLLPCLAAPAPPQVHAEAVRVPQGGVVLLRTRTPGALTARLDDKVHPFFPVPGGGQAVMVPVPWNSPLGAREVTVEGGAGGPVRVPFTATPCQGPTITVKVPPSTAKLSEADQARAAREREDFLAVYASPEEGRAWTAPFLQPGGGRVTCGFGTTRRFNGEVQSVHRGLDLRAPSGTPVRAAAPGRVRLAKDVFFGGNLIILDHGAGLFTIYAHLSRMAVKAGDEVRAGDRLGLSGATGRVSGPHLHWGASIAGVDVDPLLVRKAMASLAGAQEPAARRGHRARGSATPPRKR